MRTTTIATAAIATLTLAACGSAGGTSQERQLPEPAPSTTVLDTSTTLPATSPTTATDPTPTTTVAIEEPRFDPVEPREQTNTNTPDSPLGTLCWSTAELILVYLDSLNEPGDANVAPNSERVTQAIEALENRPIETADASLREFSDAIKRQLQSLGDALTETGERRQELLDNDIQLDKLPGEDAFEKAIESSNDCGWF